MFASLHGGLLVRKGQAAPSTPEAAPPPRSAPAEWSVERRDALSPPPGRVAPLRVVEKPEAEPESATEASWAEPAFHRVEVRLTPDQARRLGVAAARLGQPKRRLMTKALDAYLRVLGEGPLKGCGCFGGEAGEGCCRER